MDTLFTTYQGCINSHNERWHRKLHGSLGSISAFLTYIRTSRDQLAALWPGNELPTCQLLDQIFSRKEGFSSWRERHNGYVYPWEKLQPITLQKWMYPLNRYVECWWLKHDWNYVVFPSHQLQRNSLLSNFSPDLIKKQCSYLLQVILPYEVRDKGNPLGFEVSRSIIIFK